MWQQWFKRSHVRRAPRRLQLQPRVEQLEKRLVLNYDPPGPPAIQEQITLQRVAVVSPEADEGVVLRVPGLGGQVQVGDAELLLTGYIFHAGHTQPFTFENDSFQSSAGPSWTINAVFTHDECTPPSATRIQAFLVEVDVTRAGKAGLGLAGVVLGAGAKAAAAGLGGGPITSAAAGIVVGLTTAAIAADGDDDLGSGQGDLETPADPTQTTGLGFSLHDAKGNLTARVVFSEKILLSPSDDVHCGGTPPGQPPVSEPTPHETGEQIYEPLRDAIKEVPQIQRETGPEGSRLYDDRVQHIRETHRGILMGFGEMYAGATIEEAYGLQGTEAAIAEFTRGRALAAGHSDIDALLAYENALVLAKKAIQTHTPGTNAILPFSLSVAPEFFSWNGGANPEIPIAVWGRTKPVTLSVTGLPSGVQAEFVPVVNGLPGGPFHLMRLSIPPNFAPGIYTGQIRASDGQTTDQKPFTLVVNPAGHDIVVGADAGAEPRVRILHHPGGGERASLFPFGTNFTGGVRVATGDVNGDSIPDIITAAGPGGGSQIKVFDGASLNVFPFIAAGEAGRIDIAWIGSGDVNGDGRDDIITATGAGTSPNVKVFSGQNGAELASFVPFAGDFQGGVTVAVGDVNADGFDDIITGTGPGGGPAVKVFDGKSLTELSNFFAYDPSFQGGVFVAAGDVNGDGHADIITGAGAGAGAGPQVKVFSGLNGTELASFFAYAPEFQGGVRVAADDVNGDGISDIITGAGPGSGPQVKVFNGPTLTELDGFFAFDPGFTGGTFVAGTPGDARIEKQRFFRTYDRNANVHFFTTSLGEFQALTTRFGHDDETTGRPGFSLVKNPVVGALPLHRLYNPNNGSHYYTSSKGERDQLVRLGWRYEQDEGFIFPSPTRETVEILHLYNRASGAHLYTENSGVRDAVLKLPGWEQHLRLGFAFASGVFTAPASATAQSAVAPAVSAVMRDAGSEVAQLATQVAAQRPEIGRQLAELGAVDAGGLASQLDPVPPGGVARNLRFDARSSTPTAPQGESRMPRAAAIRGTAPSAQNTAAGGADQFWKLVGSDFLSGDFAAWELQE